MIRERRYGSGGDLFLADGDNIVDRWSRNGENGFADHSYNTRGCDNSGSTLAELLPVSSSSPASPLQNKSPPHSCYIQHSVNKYDTLAGVAIRYGVEVLLILLMFSSMENDITRWLTDSLNHYYAMIEWSYIDDILHSYLLAVDRGIYLKCLLLVCIYTCCKKNVTGCQLLSC